MFALTVPIGVFLVGAALGFVVLRPIDGCFATLALGVIGAVIVGFLVVGIVGSAVGPRGIGFVAGVAILLGPLAALGWFCGAGLSRLQHDPYEADDEWGR